MLSLGSKSMAMIGIYFKIARAQFCTLYACPFIYLSRSAQFSTCPFIFFFNASLTILLQQNEHHLFFLSILSPSLFTATNLSHISIPLCYCSQRPLSSSLCYCYWIDTKDFIHQLHHIFQSYRENVLL
jgi:hypothetical protein